MSALEIISVIKSYFSIKLIHSTIIKIMQCNVPPASYIFILQYFRLNPNTKVLKFIWLLKTQEKNYCEPKPFYLVSERAIESQYNNSMWPNPGICLKKGYIGKKFKIIFLEKLYFENRLTLCDNTVQSSRGTNIYSNIQILSNSSIKMKHNNTLTINIFINL